MATPAHVTAVLKAFEEEVEQTPKVDAESSIHSYRKIAVEEQQPQDGP